MRGIIDKGLEIRIKLICEKLKNSISTIDIINWLSNFDEFDRLDMLELLDRFRYFNETELIQGYMKCINQLVNSINVRDISKIALHPIGKFGKSGTAMMYFFNKALKQIKINCKIDTIPHYDYFAEIILDEKTNRHKKVVLVLIDDFFGSGKTAVDYYNDHIESEINKLSVNTEIYFISFVCLETAKQYFARKLPSVKLIYSELESKAFSQDKYTLGSKEKIVRLRTLCYDYALKKDLFSIRDHKNNKLLKYPLGYENSQALIGFSFGTPNNTLPIFWSSKNGWFPLFPRMTDERIFKLKEYRKEVACYLGIARAIGLTELVTGVDEESIEKSIYVSKNDFQLFALLKFKMERKSKLIICRLLGIMESDYENILELAKKRDFIDSNEQLTANGYKIYNEVTQYFNKYKKYKEDKEVENRLSYNNDLIYIPSTFRGKT